jgi:hypothetical protein
MTAVHHLILAGLSAIVGLCAGSFLNVCVHRLPLGLSIWRPRSRCPHCSSPIRVRDNVPLLSWCLLRGRCRDCQAAISSRYLFVELSVGVLFAGTCPAVAVLPTGELWDRMGPMGGLLLTLALWVLISLFVVGALVFHDGRVTSASFDGGRGIGGQDQPHAGPDRGVVPEPVLVQLGDFAGSARVAEAISCDATERFVTADDVNRLGSRLSHAAGPLA